ncbi:MAG: DUF3575 domain-containing protein, partial [Alistipes sp.]|nr:DUF3575 domain-containing protein [Alistipes sp.]
VYFGLYGEMGDFNRQEGRADKVNTDLNFTGDYWSAGVSVGYMLPLSKHWCAELSLRGGYRSATYDKYTRTFEDDGIYHYDDGTPGKKSQFALTGVRLNIVYRFGRGRR